MLSMNQSKLILEKTPAVGLWAFMALLAKIAHQSDRFPAVAIP
jgi:hypothetical protein